MVRMDSYLLKSLTHGKIRGLAQLCMICIVNLSRTAHVHDNLLEWLGTLIYSKLRNGDKSPFKKSILKYSLKCSIPGIHFIHMPSICIVLLCKNNPHILSLTNHF